MVRRDTMGWEASCGCSMEEEADRRGIIGASGRLQTALRRKAGVAAHRVQTVGWEASCRHGEDRVVPAIVLDPFSGSGTTGVMARRLGRRYIGIELNPEYVEMSRQRIDGDMPLFNRSGE